MVSKLGAQTLEGVCVCQNLGRIIKGMNFCNILPLSMVGYGCGGGVCYFGYVINAAKSHESHELYSLYWQGFKHPVSLPMPSISMLAISYFSLLYSLRGEEKARIWKL